MPALLLLENEGLPEMEETVAALSRATVLLDRLEMEPHHAHTVQTQGSCLSRVSG